MLFYISSMSSSAKGRQWPKQPTVYIHSPSADRRRGLESAFSLFSCIVGLYFGLYSDAGGKKVAVLSVGDDLTTMSKMPFIVKSETPKLLLKCYKPVFFFSSLSCETKGPSKYFLLLYFMRNLCMSIQHCRSLLHFGTWVLHLNFIQTQLIAFF